MSMRMPGNSSAGGSGWSDPSANYPLPINAQPGVPNRILPPASTIEDVSLMYPTYSGNTSLPQQFPSVPWVPNRDNQGSSGKMWKSDKNNETNRADFLGTGQWGLESGGAPWGQASASDASPSEQLTDASNAITSGGNYKDVGRTMAEYVLGTPVDPTRGALMISEANILTSSKSMSETKSSKKPGSSVSSYSSGDAPNSTPASTNNSPTNSQPDSSPTGLSSDNNQSEKVETNGGQKESAETKSEENPEESPTENNSPQSGSETKPEEEVGEESDSKEGGDMAAAVDGTMQQMQQLNLDSYAMSMQQQMALAVQQQYMLAAQQQQLGMPGVFLSNLNPYIIAGHPSNAAAAAGYTDPATAAAHAQYSVMAAQYAPYTWPAYAPLQTMPPPNIAPTTPSVTSSTPTSQSQSSSANTRNSNQLSRSPFQSEGGATPDTPQLQNQSSDPGSNTALPQPQFGFNPMAMGAAGYQMIPTAYYDQTGAFIVNNGRGGPLGAPVRLFAPAPFVMNGANVPSSGAVYSNPNMTGGSSTPVAGQGPLYNPNMNMPPFGFNGSQGLGTSFTSQASGMGGSSSSTPQRRDSFSDPYSKHPGAYPSHVSNFYNQLSGSMGMGAISPSPGPFGVLGQPPSHHSMSPPPSLSSPTNSLIGANHRQFPVAPGAEARYKNGGMMNAGIFGSSGSALFPPTRLRPISASGRSRLLDDFRNNRYPNPQLRDLVNHIVEFSRDQHGSRFIQQKLERAAPPEKQLVFNEISGAAYQLMTDVFGNYVIQKFFEFGSQEQKLALAQCIRGHVLALALQMYGCRVIQKALECIPQEEQVNIVKELDGHLLECVKDQNGNHVVQKCIECVKPVHLQFIVESFNGNVVTLSRHPYGCRVMQRILEHCTVEQTTPILEELNQHIEKLVMDQYGNYVIQHILEHGRPENKRSIVLELRGKVLTLSQHKFASNVVEKCVSNSPPQERILLIEEVCQDDESLYFMMKDQFANYVVQKMLDVAESEQRTMLIAKIRPHMQHLRKYTYGKHIINKLEKFMMKPNSVPTSPSIGNPASPTHQQSSITLEETQQPQNVLPNMN